MRAYPDNNKQIYIERVKAHRLADELIAGIGWDGKKGCSVGCTVECYDRAKYARVLGIPLVLANLQEAIFEGLPLAERLAFPERFLESIKEGSDLSEVWPKFASRMLTRGLARIGDGNEESTTQCSESESAAWAEEAATAWAAARSARSAVASDASAAWAAARSEAAWALAEAWSARSAARSAEAAARASKLAARSAESEAAEAAEYAAQADDLIELVEAAIND